MSRAGAAIYFVREARSGAIKIGYSRDPSGRVAAAQAWVPVQLELVATVAGDVRQENYLHHLFASSRLITDVSQWDAMFRAAFSLARQ